MNYRNLKPLTDEQIEKLIDAAIKEDGLEPDKAQYDLICEQVAHADANFLDAVLVPNNIKITTVIAIIRKVVTPYVPPPGNERYYAEIAEDEARRNSAWRSK